MCHMAVSFRRPCVNSGLEVADIRNGLLREQVGVKTTEAPAGKPQAMVDFHVVRRSSEKLECGALAAGKLPGRVRAGLRKEAKQRRT